MVMKNFSETILLLKVDLFQGFLNRCKINGIMQIAVTQNHFKILKGQFTIFKQAYQLKERSYGFEDTTLSLKASTFKGLLNWNKID